MKGDAMKTHRNNKALRMTALVSFLFSVFIFLSASGVSTKGNNVIDSLHFAPLLQSPSVACKAISANASTDPKAHEIATRLSECINTIRSKQQKSSATATPAPSKQRSQLAELRKKLSEELDVRFHFVSGTPRQIKIKPEAKRRGVVLGRAVGGFQSTRERDEKTAREFLRSKRNLVRISNPDEELRLSRYSEDELGRRHLRYEQSYKGLPVWPAELNIHLDKYGNADLMNGAYVPSPRRLVTKPVLNVDAAIRQAHEVVPGSETAGNGKSELIVYAPEDRMPRLAWKIEVPVSIESKWLVVIDALNGTTLTAFNQAMNANVAGSGTDLFGKKQQLNVWREGSQYYMVDTTKQMYDITSKPPALDATRGAIMIYDMGNNSIPDNGNISLQLVKSQNPTSGWLSDAVSLAWCFSKTYDYYLSRHNRNSFDGKGCSIVGAVRWSRDLDNAMFSSDANMMFFGDGAPNAGSVDVVAHEFTHGVTTYESGLIYKNQSGALNEAFSDIFGEMVEAYSYGNADWINGAVLNDNGRNSKDPSHQKIDPGSGEYYPSKMSEFYATTADNGGVHINCTILSHCCYLLAEGMQGAIGLRDAEKIFYRAQKFHLVSNSQFIDCRLACIASAEELFGENSSQAQKVAQAFDAVEIYDNNKTPEPPSVTPVGGKDATMFVSYSSIYGGYYLTRQEDALGDSSEGSWISCYDIAQARPSVSGDGSLAFFVDGVNDACFIATDTDGNLCEECLGFAGEISSVAMSPDGQIYGFVLLDEFGEPDNSIMVVDLRPGGQSQTYTLVSPSIDGVALNTVMFADAMDFSSDNRYLLYDAYNVMQFNDGAMIGVWSIYAIDLLSGQTMALFGPLAGVDIGYPSISQTTNHLMTFDVLDESTGVSSILAVNLISSEYNVVGTVANTWGIPGFTGNDRAIVYTRKDSSTSTGYSLMKRALLADKITPTGASTLFMKDASYGVIYRRGDFNPPVPNISISPDSLNFGTVSVGGSLKKQITISNTGTSDLDIEKISIAGEHAPQFKIAGGCAGQTLPASGSCKFYVEFRPNSTGAKSAEISMKSNDPAKPTRNIQLSGAGGSDNNQAPSKLLAKAASSTQIILSWKDNSNNETGFKIERKMGSCGSDNAWEQIAAKPKNTTSHIASGLSPNKNYAFRIRSYQSSSYSSYSNCASAKTGLPGTPPAPTNFKATSASPSMINLKWKDNSADESGFKIYRKTGAGTWTLLKTTVANVKSFTDSSADKNQSLLSYQYYVCSYNDFGNSPASNIAIVPYKPSTLATVQGTSTLSVTLTWTDNSANETGFEIYRKAGGCASTNAWELIKTVGVNVKTWTNTGLTSGNRYSYQVRAYNKSAAAPNAYGYSQYSNCSSAISP
jgi:bacillolysin